MSLKIFGCRAFDTHGKFPFLLFEFRKGLPCKIDQHELETVTWIQSTHMYKNLLTLTVLVTTIDALQHFETG